MLFSMPGFLPEILTTVNMRPITSSIRLLRLKDERIISATEPSTTLVTIEAFFNVVVIKQVVESLEAKGQKMFYVLSIHNMIIYDWRLYAKL